MKIIQILVVALPLFGCASEKGSCPLERFEFFILDKNGNPLITAVKQNVAVYCVKNGRYDLGGECRECDMIRATSNGDLYYSTAEAPQLSARNGIINYYIEINGDIDTVRMTAGFTSTEKCVIINDVLFNGNPAFDRRDTPTMAFTSGFVFKKQ